MVSFDVSTRSGLMISFIIADCSIVDEWNRYCYRLMRMTVEHRSPCSANYVVEFEPMFGSRTGSLEPVLEFFWRKKASQDKVGV